MRQIYVLLLLCSALLAGCASATSTALRAPTIARLTPTIVQQPVVLAVSATSQGTVAAKNVLLDTKVAITNNTAAPIHITYLGCATPLVKLTLYNQSGVEGWQNYLDHGTCPNPFPHDDRAIAPSASYIWTSDLLIANMALPTLHLQANVPYRLIADLVFWHQGDLSQMGTPIVPQGSDVMAQTTITFS